MIHELQIQVTNGWLPLMQLRDLERINRLRDVINEGNELKARVQSFNEPANTCRHLGIYRGELCPECGKIAQ